MNEDSQTTPFADLVRRRMEDLEQLLHEAALGWTFAPQDWRRRATALLATMDTRRPRC